MSSVISRIQFTMAALLFAGLATGAWAQRGGGNAAATATQVEPLEFRYMGPAASGRVASVAGVDGDPNTWYVGNASGGLWKSTDGGHTFLSLFDNQDVSAIGTITVAPSDANTVWVGTGEPWVIRPSDVIGDGVYKSTDAGAHWQHMGLIETGRIARILVNPTNPNTVFVCAEGKLTGPENDRGVYRSTDGGANWTHVLFVNPQTSCSSLSMDAHDPNTLFAGTWQVEQHTWGEFSGGAGSGIYVTHNNGEQWTRVEDAGLPKSPQIGKVDVEVAPSDSKRVYALIQTADQGSLWRSEDGGAHWAVVSWDRSLIGRAGYYIKMAIDPKNEDDVLISSSSFHRSTDGGKTFGGNGGGGGGGGRGGPSCGDCHDIWVDATASPIRYALTDDGGASLGTGTGTVSVRMPNGQMYHVAVDNRVPYWIYSNRQDDGTMRGPSTVSESSGSALLPIAEFMPSGGGGRGGGRGGAAPAGAAGAAGGRGGAAPAAGAGAAGAAAPAPGGARGGALTAPAATFPAGFTNNAPAAGAAGGGGGRGGAALAWQPDIGGCESGFTIPDPTDANIVWATCYGNKLTRYDAREGEAHSVEPWMISLDSPPNQARYRCHWTAPLAIDPFDHNTVYYGCQNILKTSNGGQSWTEFSPDLSTKDPTRIVSNGGLVGDNLGQYDGEVVWAIAPSTIRQGLIWAGTNDGKLWVKKDASAVWTDVSKNLGLPAWGQYDQIAPSTFDPGTAYVVADFHLVDDYKPYLLKTTDFGATWKRITGDLPASNPLDYALSLTENPNRKGMLFAGTAHAFFYSLDDGGHWTQFSAGLPPAPVSWIVVEPRFHDVVISTYGRGLFILPDIAVLEQSGQVAAPAATTQLFAPTPMFRMARSAYPTAAEPMRPDFMFNLADAPGGAATLEIFDSAGQSIRKQQLTVHKGMNGAYWDLHYEGPTLVALKTTPEDNPHIWDEPRFQNTDTRRITHWGITAGTGVPVAAPGKYQVKLTVDGKSYTQPFVVLKDPAVAASDADLQASTAAQVRIRDDITQTSTMVNKMEVWRKQIEDQLKKSSGQPDQVKALQALSQTILDVELKLVTRSEMLSDDKYFPEAYKVYMNLIWLSGGVGEGASDEAGGLDYKPTDTQMQVLKLIETDMAAAKVSFDKLTAVDVPGFNKTWAGKITITP